MIELFSANTPNGKKISIMLEEIAYEYKVTKVDINNGEQFTEKFGYGSTFPRVLRDGKLIGGCSETITVLRNEGRI